MAYLTGTSGATSAAAVLAVVAGLCSVARLYPSNHLPDYGGAATIVPAAIVN